MEAERQEETRHLILRQARVLFMELGYRAVTTRMVASACGLTQPALYHHFGGKQDLYVAVLMDELDRLRRGLTAIVRSRRSSLERLERAASFLTEHTDVDHALMAHDIRWELSPDRRSHVSLVFRQSLVEPMGIILGGAVEEGTVRNPADLGVPIPVLVMHFLNVIRFVVTSDHVTPMGDRSGPGGSHRDRANLVLTLFLGGMGPAQEGMTAS